MRANRTLPPRRRQRCPQIYLLRRGEDITPEKKKVEKLDDTKTRLSFSGTPSPSSFGAAIKLKAAQARLEEEKKKAAAAQEKERAERNAATAWSTIWNNAHASLEGSNLLVVVSDAASTETLRAMLGPLLAKDDTRLEYAATPKEAVAIAVATVRLARLRCDRVCEGTG